MATGLLRVFLTVSTALGAFGMVATVDNLIAVWPMQFYIPIILVVFFVFLALAGLVITKIWSLFTE